MIPDYRGLFWLAVFGIVCATVLATGVAGFVLWHLGRALALYLGVGR